MRSFTSVLLTIILGSTMIGAPGLKETSPKTPEIVGKWELVRCSQGGKTTSLVEVAVDTEFSPEGKQISRNSRGTVVGTRFYTLDLKATPFCIDFRQKEDGPVTGRGIFMVEGDTLTICLVPAEDNRPTKFESPVGSKSLIHVYTRVKKK
jgi:uncharacterized protein (TIGR03067 family)